MPGFRSRSRVFEARKSLVYDQVRLWEMYFMSPVMKIQGNTSRQLCSIGTAQKRHLAKE
jgi:hypothetical protein